MISNKLKTRILKIAYGNLHLPDSRFKHFTFITERNKILSWGCNLGYTTHPISAKFGHRFQAIHSELDAIRNFPLPIRHLYGTCLVNIRICKNGTIGKAKPCRSCINMLRYFRCQSIVYSIVGGYERYII